MVICRQILQALTGRGYFLKRTQIRQLDKLFHQMDLKDAVHYLFAIQVNGAPLHNFIALTRIQADEYFWELMNQKYRKAPDADFNFAQFVKTYPLSDEQKLVARVLGLIVDQLDDDEGPYYV